MANPCLSRGGSSLAINGALTDNNTVDIGDEFLNANDTVTATSLVVNGFDNADCRLEGRLGGPGSLLNVASAAGFGAAGLLWGNVDLIGDATIEFASGQITSIADDGFLAVAGNDAFIADAGALTSNSALTGLSTVAGNLYLNSGATLTTAGSLTLNEGSLEVDSSGGEAFGIIGGSSLTINGQLNLSGYYGAYVSIGNSNLNAAVTVTVNSIAITSDYQSDLYLNGKVGGAAALLDIKSAAGFGTPDELDDGNVVVLGNSAIEFASGEITTIGYYGALTVNGDDAFVEDAGPSAPTAR